MSVCARRCVALGVLAAPLVTLACGSNGGVSPKAYVVQYTIIMSGPVAVDSLKYDDGSGAFVTPTSIPPGSVFTVSHVPPVSIQAQAFLFLGVTSTATLRETWSRLGGATQADSAQVSASVPGPATLTAPHHFVSF
jgi:hypothetical protein